MISMECWSTAISLAICLYMHPLQIKKEKKKLDVDALDDFIQNLLMCLLCTINLKPLGVSEQSVAFAAILLLGKMISCFVNCRDGDTCILMGNFRYPCIFIYIFFVESKWVIAELFVTSFFFFFSSALDILFIGQKQAEIFDSLCINIVYYLFHFDKLVDTF